MDSLRLRRLLSFYEFYLSTTLAILQYLISFLPKILINLSDTALSLYFRFCGMSPCTVDINDTTTMHFWTTNHRKFDKPNLVLVHGYGGHSRWQFSRQVRSLSESFNLYIPDLLFFGNSYTHQCDRSDYFQARCVGEGLKRLGVDRFSVFGISYGGYVTYRMAEMYKEEIDKVVIVSCGICYEGDQQVEHVRTIGRDPLKTLLPEKPDDLRFLINMTMYKYDPMKWLPDFFLWEFINAMCKEHRNEKLELLKYMLAKRADSDLPILTQETLLIWGDQDNVFPLFLAHQLQRHLGPKSKLEILKDAGHAVNIDSPVPMNVLIKSFVLGCSK